MTGSVPDRERRLQRIWNRSLESDGLDLFAGDVELRAVILLDEDISSGGLDAAVASLATEEGLRAAESFRYFGLLDAAELITRAVRAYAKHGDDPDADHIFDELGKAYYEEVDADVLTDALSRRYEVSPDDFAPLPSA